MSTAPRDCHFLLLLSFTCSTVIFSTLCLALYKACGHEQVRTLKKLKGFPPQYIRVQR